MNIQAYMLLAVALSLSRCGAQHLRIGAPALGQLTPLDRGDVTSTILGEDYDRNAWEINLGDETSIFFRNSDSMIDSNK